MMYPPFTLKPLGNNCYDMVSGHNTIMSNEGYDNIAPDYETAEFIVRACNAHDDLVTALEKAKGYVEATWLGLRNVVGDDNIVKPTIGMIDAALAKANGEVK